MMMMMMVINESDRDDGDVKSTSSTRIILSNPAAIAIVLNSFLSLVEKLVGTTKLRTVPD